MKLPNAERAVVPSRKITHYLLSTAHRDGQHKAEFFSSFGFTIEAWEELAAALQNHARKSLLSRLAFDDSDFTIVKTG